MGKLLGRGRDAPPARYSVVDRSRAAAVVALARHAGVEVAVEAPVVQDERTKEILREYAELHPEDPRQEIWAKL